MRLNRCILHSLTSIRPQRSSRMLELASVHPFLRLTGEGTVPSQSDSIMLLSDSIMQGEVEVDVSL